MKEVPLIITLHAAVLGTFIWFAGPAGATVIRITKPVRISQNRFRRGLDALKNFNGEQTLPGYTSRPDQTKYYGGVTASGDSS
jgi:conjugal transfer mating pair stabilization protein TraN